MAHNRKDLLKEKKYLEDDISFVRKHKKYTEGQKDRILKNLKDSLQSVKNKLEKK